MKRINTTDQSPPSVAEGSNKSIFGGDALGECYFFGCVMTPKTGRSRESRIEEMSVKKSENIAIFTFEYPPTDDKDEILFGDLLSCSIELNKIVQVILLYFRGLTMRTTETKHEIIHEQVDNKHGVGVSVHCDLNHKIRKVVIETDYLKTSLLFNELKKRIKSDLRVREEKSKLNPRVET